MPKIDDWPRIDLAKKNVIRLHWCESGTHLNSMRRPNLYSVSLSNNPGRRCVWKSLPGNSKGWAVGVGDPIGSTQFNHNERLVDDDWNVPFTRNPIPIHLNARSLISFFLSFFLADGKEFAFDDGSEMLETSHICTHPTHHLKKIKKGKKRKENKPLVKSNQTKSINGTGS